MIDPGPPSLAHSTASTDRPLWSVMIPVHNCAHYLGNTLDEVVQQLGDRDDVEIIVVDDMSNDRPDLVVEEVGRGRVRYHRLDRPHGAIANFNTCLALSTGVYVHLLHGDDGVLPGFYAAAENALADSTFVAACCRSYYIDDHGRRGKATRSERSGTGPWDRAFPTLLISNRIRPASIVVRRDHYESIGGFRSELPHAADWEMWARVARHGRISFIDEPLALYRRHDQSDTAARVDSGANIRERIRAIELITEGLEKGHRWAQVKSLGYSATFACRQSVMLVARGRFSEALGQLKGAGATLAAAVRSL